MEKKRDGQFLGSYEWNRGSRNRKDEPKEEEWAWHDRD